MVVVQRVRTVIGDSIELQDVVDQERDLTRAFGALSGTGFGRGIEQARRGLRNGMDERIESMKQ